MSFVCIICLSFRSSVSISPLLEAFAIPFHIFSKGFSISGFCTRVPLIPSLSSFSFRVCQFPSHLYRQLPSFHFMFYRNSLSTSVFFNYVSVFLHISLFLFYLHFCWQLLPVHPVPSLNSPILASSLVFLPIIIFATSPLSQFSHLCKLHPFQS